MFSAQPKLLSKSVTSLQVAREEDEEWSKSGLKLSDYIKHKRNTNSREFIDSLLVVGPKQTRSML